MLIYFFSFISYTCTLTILNPYAVKNIHVLTQYEDLICYMKLLRLGLSRSFFWIFVAFLMHKKNIGLKVMWEIVQHTTPSGIEYKRTNTYDVGDGLKSKKLKSWKRAWQWSEKASGLFRSTQSRPQAGRIFVSYQTACRWVAMFPRTDCMLYTQPPGSDLGHFQACIRSTVGQRGLYVPQPPKRKRKDTKLLLRYHAV